MAKKKKDKQQSTKHYTEIKTKDRATFTRGEEVQE